MTTKEEMIAIIKAENPDGLRIGSDSDGYTMLPQEECENIYSEWAQVRLDRMQTEENEKNIQLSVFAKLAALGLTADEAAFLLG